MSEAKQMYRDLMNMLLPILPRSVYGDIRRVSNLVWASRWCVSDADDTLAGME